MKTGKRLQKWLALILVMTFVFSVTQISLAAGSAYQEPHDVSEDFEDFENPDGEGNSEEEEDHKEGKNLNEDEEVTFSAILNANISITGDGVYAEVDDSMSMTVFRVEEDGTHTQMTHAPEPIEPTALSNAIRTAWAGRLPWSVGTGTGNDNFHNGSAKLLSASSGYVTTGTRSTGNVTGNEVAHDFVVTGSLTETNVITYFGPGDRLTVTGRNNALDLTRVLVIETSNRNPGVLSVTSKYRNDSEEALAIARFVENNYKIYDPLPADRYIATKREAGLWTQQGAALVWGMDYVIPVYNTMGLRNPTAMNAQRCAAGDLISRNNWFWGENGGLPFNSFWGEKVGITIGFATPHKVRSGELPTRGSGIADRHDTAYQWVGWPGKTLEPGELTDVGTSFVGVFTGDNFTGSRQFTQAMSYIPNLCINGHELPADWLAPPDPNHYADYNWENTVESWGGGEGFDPMRGIDMVLDGTFKKMGIKYVVLDAAWYPRGTGNHNSHNPGYSSGQIPYPDFTGDPAYIGLTSAQQETLYRVKTNQWAGEGNYLAIPAKWVSVANYFGIQLNGPFDYDGAKKTVRAWNDFMHEHGFKTGAWCMPMSVYLHPGNDTGWTAAVPGSGAVVSGRDLQIDTAFTNAFPDYLITANAAEYDPVTGKLKPDSVKPLFRRQTGYYPQNGTGELCLGNPKVLNEYTDYFANLIFDEYGFDGLKIDTQWGTQQCFALGHGHDDNPNAGFENYSIYWKRIYDKGKEILGEDPWLKHCQCGTMMSFFTQNGTNRPITGDPGSSNVRKARYSMRMWKGLYGDNAPVVSDHVSNFGRRVKSLMAAGHVMETRAWTPTDQDFTNANSIKYFNLAITEGLASGYYMDEYKFGFDFPEVLAFDRPDKHTKYYSVFASNAPISGFTGGSPYVGGGETTMNYTGPVELRGLEPGKRYRVLDYAENTYSELHTADSDGIIRLEVEFTECMLLKAVEVLITSIKTDALSITTIARYETRNFRVVLNAGVSDENIVWTIADPSLGYVDSDGNVTIFDKIGNVRLTATDPISGLSHSITLRIAS